MRPGCAPGSATNPNIIPNTANCGEAIGSVTDVGSYINSPSPYGTFDQGGNVEEWNEWSVFGGAFRGVAGGDWLAGGGLMAAGSSFGQHTQPTFEDSFFGFRVASAGEPNAPEPDSDGDGVPDNEDKCPLDVDPDQRDIDGDGVGDVCDNCVPLANADQADHNDNGVGDVCDALAVTQADLDAAIAGIQSAFGALESATVELGSRVSLIENSAAAQSAEVSTLQGQVAAIQAAIASAESRLGALEASDVAQTAEIQALRNDLEMLKGRMERIENLPGIRNRPD